MRPRNLLALLAMLCLLLLTAIYVVRVSRHWHGTRLELGRVKLSHLSGETRRRLETLSDDVFVTYYVSQRSRMPSSMRRVERGVTEVLEAFRQASKGRLEYQIVDPDVTSDLARYAARRSVAPFRARSVERDAYSERTVWSTITIAYGARPESAINGIGPEHVPRLQSLLVQYLNQMERPRKPLIALSASSGFSDLASALSERAQLWRINLDEGHAIPPEADLLMWLDASDAPPARLRELQQFLESGRPLFISGSEHILDFTEIGGAPALSIRRSAYPAETILAHFGLRPVPGLITDKSSDQLVLKEKKIDAPFLLRCNGYNQNFRGLRNEPSGNFLFLAPTPIALDGAQLAERGWSAQVLATTSEHTWTEPVPDKPVFFTDLAPEKGEAISKQPLMVLLRPVDPWKGSVIVCGSSTPFQDGFLKREGAAHRRLLQSLLENLVPVERLVINRAEVFKPKPLPELSWGERIFWRAAAIFLFPALLIGMAWSRGVFSLRVEPALKMERRLGGVVLRGCAGLVAALVAIWCAKLPGLRVDFTRGRLNELAPETRAIAAEARGENGVKVELVFSQRDRLPPVLRPLVGRARQVLDALRRAGAELSISQIYPEDLDASGRTKLAAMGIEPIKTTTQEEELTTVRTVYSAMRLSWRGQSEVLRFPHPPSFENLEFRLSFALWRLKTGLHPHIAFASDTPRLSAAEAYEQYQTQGLFAPMGTDVYSLARDFLEECDFRVTHVNTREPVFPDHPDLFVWLQPRRPVEKLLTAAVRYLHEGGHVLLAAQHFNIQSRQYRGGENFKIVYWPQPQSPDVERYYFPELGIDLVREVLFDELKTRITTDTQVNRSATRPDFDKQTSALPFLIRAAAANFNPGSPITANVGDQAFIWGSFIRCSPDKLLALGIHATPLITTSSRTWSFKWKGGWLPGEVLDPALPDGEGKRCPLGKEPLAVLFEGQFPLKEIVREEGLPSPPGLSGPPVPKEGAAEAGAPVPSSPGKEGKLLFLGCSEMFKNHRLFDPEFRADRLLLNCVASLGLDKRLAAIACRRLVPRGFDYVEQRSRLSWRIFVISSGPLLFIALGILRWVRNARSRWGRGRT